MRKDLASRLWSWSIHTGDTLFSEAADEIENLKKQLSNSYSAVFKNSENLNKELDKNSTDSSRELDIVEELVFFAEAADSDAIVVTMLSGGLFLEAAKEIEHLRLLIQEAVESREARDQAASWHNLDAKNKLSLRTENAWKALKNSIGRKTVIGSMADEIEFLKAELHSLRALITSWGDADDADFPPNERASDCTCDKPFCLAARALRMAVG